jgi:hypothetical protein
VTHLIAHAAIRMAARMDKLTRVGLYFFAGFSFIVGIYLFTTARRRAEQEGSRGGLFDGFYSVSRIRLVGVGFCIMGLMAIYIALTGPLGE